MGQFGAKDINDAVFTHTQNSSVDLCEHVKKISTGKNNNNNFLATFAGIAFKRERVGPIFGALL